MEIIRNDAEFEKFYYYKSKPDKYPKIYPCIAEHVFVSSGIGGDYVEHRVFIIPNNVDPLSYLRGMIAYKSGISLTLP